jgi:hypothetical protein
MTKMLFSLCPLLLLFPSSALGQECKARFSVAYTDGKTTQPGMSADQLKFWKQNAEKKYKGLCLDDEKPQFLLVWSDALENAHISQGITDDVNRIRRAPSSTNTRSQGTEKSSMRAISSASIHDTAYVFLFDLSQEPAAMVYKGKGEAARPLEAAGSSRTSRGSTVVRGNESVSASDFSRTIADPVEAMKGALEWLKKK